MRKQFNRKQCECGCNGFDLYQWDSRKGDVLLVCRACSREHYITTPDFGVKEYNISRIENYKQDDNPLGTIIENTIEKNKEEVDEENEEENAKDPHDYKFEIGEHVLIKSIKREGIIVDRDIRYGDSKPEELRPYLRGKVYFIDINYKDVILPLGHDIICVGENNLKPVEAVVHDTIHGAVKQVIDEAKDDILMKMNKDYIEGNEERIKYYLSKLIRGYCKINEEKWANQLYKKLYEFIPFRRDYTLELTMDVKLEANVLFALLETLDNAEEEERIYNEALDKFAGGLMKDDPDISDLPNEDGDGMQDPIVDEMLNHADTVELKDEQVTLTIDQLINCVEDSNLTYETKAALQKRLTEPQEEIKFSDELTPLALSILREQISNAYIHFTAKNTLINIIDTIAKKTKE